ncbi:MAG: type III-B CRISPR module RAMP protein Cmr6 [Candidatus Baldrarchaeia archaeon]
MTTSRPNILELHIRHFLHEAIERGRTKKEDMKRNLLIQLSSKILSHEKDVIIDRCKKYLDELSNHLKKLSSTVVRIDIESTSRVIIDVSGPMGWLIDEIGLAWDPVLDAPYISSSSLRGVFRHSSIVIFTETLISSQKLALDKALKMARFITDVLFGSPSGAVQPPAHISMFCLTDAYPVSAEPGSSLVDPDVLSPHYSLTEKTFKEHEVSPTPIVFLTLPPKMIMRFFVYPNYRISKEIGKAMKQPYPESLSVILEKISSSSDTSTAEKSCKECIEILKNIKTEETFEQLLKDIVSNAVSNIGLGGKTSSGYGYFRIKSFEVGGEEW